MLSTIQRLQTLNITFAVIIGLSLASLSQAAFSATVSIGSGTGSPGNEITILVAISAQPGEAPSGVQLDMDFSSLPVSVSEVRAGEKATEAGKEIHSSYPQDGVLRILVVGLNQNVIDDGAIAEVVFTISNDAEEGAYPLLCTNAVVTNSAGEAIATDTVDGTLDILPPSMLDFSVTKAKISQNKKTPGQKAKILGNFRLESDKDLTQGIEITVGDYHETIQLIKDKGKLWQYKRPKGAAKRGIKKLLIKWNKKGDINRDALKFALIIDHAAIFPGEMPPGSPIEVYIDLRIGQELGDEIIAMNQKKLGKLSFPR